MQGSVEALVGELAKIQHPEVRVNVIHTGVGGITENDVILAAASNAMVVGFNVRPNAEARALAEREGVEIRTYRVIYQLTEDIEQALVGMLSPVETEETLGEAEVRALFQVSRLGTIAGCMVTSGVVRRGRAGARRPRRARVIYETTIAQLKRFKDDAREVAEGFECGILLEATTTSRRATSSRCYETREVERTDLDEPRRHGRRRRDERSPTASARPATPWRPASSASSSVELHFPEAGSLKGKRKYVKSAKAQLQNRFGASVAEVDHHELWQRARAHRRLRRPRARASCRSCSTPSER